MKQFDEYEWINYTNIYKNQILNDENEGITSTFHNTITITNNQLDWGTDDKKIDTHSKELYTEILELNPKSIFECGIGGAQRLRNIKKIFPNIKLGGIDLLKSQVEFGKDILKIESEFYNNVKIYIGDWCNDSAASAIPDKYEFVYSCAVIMHLNTDKSIRFIKNMMEISSKYIFLVEGYPNHDWNELFKLSGILEKFNYKMYIGNISNGPYHLFEKSE